MANVTTGLVVLSAVAFVLAIAEKLFTGPFLGLSAEGFAQASSTLALLAIALAVTGVGKSATP